MAIDSALPLEKVLPAREAYHPLALVLELCEVLENDKIQYCHWKSNAALDSSVCGENDLDFLVDRADESKFVEILKILGFKEAMNPWLGESSGIRNYYGYDRSSDKIVHVHAHFRLLLGNDLNKNYHLPLEKAYLDSSTFRNSIRVPEVEFEFLVFIIRMAIKHCTWDTVLTGHGNLSGNEKLELAWLSAGINPGRLRSVLNNHFHFLDSHCVEECVRSFQHRSSLLEKIRCGTRLQTHLKPFAQNPAYKDLILKLKHWFIEGIQRHIFPDKALLRFSDCGALIAVIGGDGAGKTTAVNAISDWLGKNFDFLCIHMGKPRWSITTTLVRGILKIGTLMGLYPFTRVRSDRILAGDGSVFPGYPWLIREVCTARDRFLSFKKARREASRGKLIVCDRYPLPGIKLMDGPMGERMTRSVSRNWLITFLIRLEKSYYHQIGKPDLLIVLRVAPEIALKRKPEEDPGAVLLRSSEVWNAVFKGSSTYVVDANLPKQKVITQVKDILWAGI
jgi:thymidylate kinase